MDEDIYRKHINYRQFYSSLILNGYYRTFEWKETQFNCSAWPLYTNHAENNPIWCLTLSRFGCQIFHTSLEKPFLWKTYRLGTRWRLWVRLRGAGSSTRSRRRDHERWAPAWIWLGMEHFRLEHATLPRSEVAYHLACSAGKHRAVGQHDGLFALFYDSKTSSCRISEWTEAEVQ